ncbi:MAG: flagellar basal body P-ring formation chaperone FlgA [Roseibium sp.]
MMKHLLNIAMGLLLFGTPLAGVSAKDRPVLRSQIMTLSEIVTIGDFYTNAGSVASVPLFRSPNMGTSGDVDATEVATRARSAGLETAGTDGLRTVVVHRGATRIERDHLEHIVRTALSKREAGVNPDDLVINFAHTPEQILADPKIQDPVRVYNVQWVRNSGRFTVTLSVAAEFGSKQISLSGRAVEMIEVVALAQPLGRGDILQEEDLTSIQLPKNKVASNALLDGTEIVGKEARVHMRPNQPLSSRDFQRPMLVKRSEKVTVTFDVPGMKLTSRAQAMDSGAKGDVIDVMNLQSRRIVPAIVLSRGQVRVHAANPIVASLNRETN